MNGKILVKLFFILCVTSITYAGTGFILLSYISIFLFIVIVLSLIYLILKELYERIRLFRDK